MLWLKFFLIWCNHYRGGLFSDTLISASKTFMRRDYLRSKVITYSHACILCKNTWTHHDSQLHVVNRAHKQPKFDWWCNRTIAKTCYTIQYRSACMDSVQLYRNQRLSVISCPMCAYYRLVYVSFMMFDSLLEHCHLHSVPLLVVCRRRANEKSFTTSECRFRSYWSWWQSLQLSSWNPSQQSGTVQGL